VTTKYDDLLIEKISSVHCEMDFLLLYTRMLLPTTYCSTRSIQQERKDHLLARLPEEEEEAHREKLVGGVAGGSGTEW
jgi:hypothetical protein